MFIQFFNDLPDIPTHSVTSLKLVLESTIIKPATTFGGKTFFFCRFWRCCYCSNFCNSLWILFFSSFSGLKDSIWNLLSQSILCSIFQVCKVNLFYFLLDKSLLLQLQPCTNSFRNTILSSIWNSWRITKIYWFLCHFFSNIFIHLSWQLSCFIIASRSGLNKHF